MKDYIKDVSVSQNYLYFVKIRVVFVVLKLRFLILQHQKESL